MQEEGRSIGRAGTRPAPFPRVLRILRGLSLSSVALVAACTTPVQYAQEPAAHGTVHLDGNVTVVSASPSLRGDVAVANLGLASVRAEGPAAKGSIRGLQVRLVVSNRSSVVWMMDLRQQLAVIPGYGASRAAYASARDSSPPFLMIPANSSRTADFVFPLPASLQGLAGAPPFDVMWFVAATNEPIGTPQPDLWQQAIVPTQVAPYGYFGDGGYWYDPYYGEATFRGALPLPPAYQSHEVTVE